MYQAVRNPAILISLFGSGMYKSSYSTWEAYKHLFEEHSTYIMTAEFLGAMAQAESGGNPLVIPQWKWQLTTDITRIYAPASTSAGLFQYTQPTFQDAKRFCIHNHNLATQGEFFSLRSCWFNSMYSRFWPSHAIEMTSARLHYYVKRILRKTGFSKVSVLKQQKLAAIIHLCGVRKGEKFAKSGFSFSAVAKCGSHSSQAYFNRIHRLAKKYKKLSDTGDFF